MMTWKEFKEAVEAAGVTDETKLRYIDTCFDYPLKVELGAYVGKDAEKQIRPWAKIT